MYLELISVQSVCTECQVTMASEKMVGKPDHFIG